MPPQTARIFLDYKEAEMILTAIEAMVQLQRGSNEDANQLLLRWKHWIDCNFDKPKKE